jgi:hypothetical protein
MKLPKVSGGVDRFGVNRTAEENAGILPSKCDWNCEHCFKIFGKKHCVNDPVCLGTRKACETCMSVCSALPTGSHAREVCESKC